MPDVKIPISWVRKRTKQINKEDWIKHPDIKAKLESAIDLTKDVDIYTDLEDNTFVFKQ